MRTLPEVYMDVPASGGSTAWIRFVTWALNSHPIRQNAWVQYSLRQPPSIELEEWQWVRRSARIPLCGRVQR